MTVGMWLVTLVGLTCAAWLLRLGLGSRRRTGDWLASVFTEVSVVPGRRIPLHVMQARWNFLVLVLVPGDVPDERVDDTVAHVLAPFGHRFDAWRVGGNRSGFFEAGYEPRKDPNNIGQCALCGGTGIQNDGIGLRLRAANPEFRCMGCDGSGEGPIYAEDWVDRGNRCQVRDIPLGVITTPSSDISMRWTFVPAALVTPDGHWHECRSVDTLWIGDVRRAAWIRRYITLLADYPSALAVAVEYFRRGDTRP